ncbi:MAG: RNA methyltransferase [Acidobacteriota bacterium]|nr:RNA methyltransferase [Acidobacteriota bacterium]
MTLTSAANPLVKDVRRAVQRGSLTSEGLCVAESFHLLDEALRSRSKISVVLASESAAAKVSGDFRVAVLPDKLFQTVAATETSQGVMALVRLPEWQPADLFRTPAMVVVLDGLQDPGNAGAIVRAAEAFGASGILFLKGTAHPHHPRTLRASAGSLFRMPFLTGLDAEEAASLLQSQSVAIHAAMPWTGAERLACEANLREPGAIVIGSEGHGISPALRRIAKDVAIPTAGVESLNAAMAASILLYEMRRQRA